MQSKKEISGNKKADKKKKKFIKLSTKLTWLCTIPGIVLLAVFCIISIETSNRIGYKNVKSSMVGQGVGKNVSINDNVMPMVNGLTQEMLSAKVSAQLQNPDQEKRYSSYKEMTDEFCAKFVIVKDSGIAIFDDDIVIRSSGNRQGIKTESWYEEDRINSGEPFFHYNSVIRENTAVKDNNAPMATYVCPVKDKSGKIFGAVVFEINHNQINNIIGLSTSFMDNFTFLMDARTNRLIYHSGEYNKDIFTKLEQDLDLDSLKGAQTVNDFNGEKYVVHAFKIEALPDVWCVYSINTKSINRESTATYYILVILTSLCVIFIAVMVKISTSRILSEVKDISKSLNKVAKRNYSEKMVPKSNDEVGALVEQFNSVIETLKYQAEHDQKTDFYNSMMFSQKSLEFVKSDPSKKYSIVRIDVDNFSFINDIFDWEVGNEILIKIANIVEEVFKKTSVYGYFGNDVFMVCSAYEEKEEIIDLIKEASDRIKACEDRIPITAHFGLYEGVESDSDVNVLCDYAGIALKTVKGNLLEIYAEYDKKFEEMHEIQKFVESQKNTALQNRDFYIQLQPKCNIHTGEVVGAEALVRWRDPKTAQAISPGKFIPIFEKNGFIIPLDRYVWEETCKVIRKWREKGYRDIPVSVNVSRMHIFHKDFVDDFEKLVRKYDIPPNLLEVEVTESALLENIDGLLSNVLNDLKSRGFKILMDDFASGYSSLIALQKFPFDVIKVDKALIDNIDKEDNKRFVSGIISFLQDLKKEIVVEGVEYDWQKEMLRDTGCEVIQGFCFSRPVSVEKFEELTFGICDDEDLTK